jgi:hypothetical protein
MLVRQYFRRIGNNFNTGGLGLAQNRTIGFIDMVRRANRFNTGMLHTKQ